MFSRQLLGTISIYTALIVLIAVAGIWLIVSGSGYIIGCLLIVCSFCQMIALTKKLNRFNRRIKAFFDALLNKDFASYFPLQGVGKEQAQLNDMLNYINDLLAKAENENKKQAYFYHSLLEKVPTGIVAWNTTGQIIVANSASLALLNCEQITTKQQLEQMLEGKQSLSLSQTTMKLEGDMLTLLSIKDISNELIENEDKSWNKLTHVLTHEVMNTIAPVISLSQTLSLYLGENEKASRTLQIIQQQSERLIEFTESFRRLSYLPLPELKPFSLTELLSNLQELLESDLKERTILFTVQSQPETIRVEGDSNQLSQVFLNLLKNSMQALEGQMEGKITVVVRQTDQLEIDIEDNGPGIPVDVCGQIFIPFFTTKSEGTGIGLSLCRQIIRQHGGRLELKTNYPGKVVFGIYLPSILI